MCCWGIAFRIPGIALPVGRACWRNIAHAFPPHVTFRGVCSVGEDRVARHGVHGVCIGVVTGAWSNTKETSFGVNGIQAAIGAVLHPANVVTNCFGFPAGNGGNQHGEVCLATRRWERGCDVFERALRVGEFQNEHVFCKPACIACHDRSNTQCKALLAKERVAAVSRSVRHDFASFREVHDVFVVGVARPCRIFLTSSKWCTDRMHTWHPIVVAQHVECALAHSGHDAHVDCNVCAV
ncbi:unannotated protein [freshwater metagenome]|uniref:Unannotated protein n=1 Tax=freshwater metagenome TaxID=449393 RepID=A0A6J6HHQ7_9ZZZZ